MLITYKNEGKKDGINEDRVHYFDHPFAEFILVADGQNSLRTFSPSFYVMDEIEKWIGLHEINSMQGLYATVYDALHHINLSMKMIQVMTGQQTTSSVSMAVFVKQENKVLFVQVGNTKIFRLRREEFKSISKEHTVAFEKMEQGELRNEEFLNHVDRSVLTRYFGADRNDFFEWFQDEWYEGDKYVLCTDGVYRVLEESEILELMNTSGSAEEARDLIIEVSTERQEWDDKTVAICFVG